MKPQFKAAAEKPASPAITENPEICDAFNVLAKAVGNQEITIKQIQDEIINRRIQAGDPLLKIAEDTGLSKSKLYRDLSARMV